MAQWQLQFTWRHWERSNLVKHILEGGLGGIVAAFLFFQAIFSRSFKTGFGG
jgi:hypothetical protein